MIKEVKDMYTHIIDNTVDKKAPVIYKIEIGSPEDVDYMFYVGKASNGISRPLNKYPKCVDNYEKGKFRKTYKNGEVVGLRPDWRTHVHVPLSEARQSNKSITLTMINVELSELDTVEQTMITELVAIHGKEKTMNKEFVK
jgi:hypothetical protein